MTENAPTAAIGGYRPPAASIRATYTVGDVCDELVVDIDRWNGDPAVIVAVIDALTEQRPGADVQVDAADPNVPGATVRQLRPSAEPAPTSGEAVQR